MSAPLDWDKNTHCFAELSALRQEITIQRCEANINVTAV